MLNHAVKHARQKTVYSDGMEQMGDRIKQLRVARGMTQEQLGAVCGVTKSAVCQWEIGSTANIKLQAFLKLCEALQTDPQYLIWGPQRAAPRRSERQLG